MRRSHAAHASLKAFAQGLKPGLCCDYGHRPWPVPQGAILKPFQSLHVPLDPLLQGSLRDGLISISRGGCRCEPAGGHASLNAARSWSCRSASGRGPARRESAWRRAPPARRAERRRWERRWFLRRGWRAKRRATRDSGRWWRDCRWSWMWLCRCGSFACAICWRSSRERSSSPVESRQRPAAGCGRCDVGVDRVRGDRDAVGGARDAAGVNEAGNRDQEQGIGRRGESRSCGRDG